VVSATKPFRHPKSGHTKTEKVTAMTEKSKNYNLTVKLSAKRENGVVVEVTTWCADWELMQKFISEFESTLLKGNNGKT